MSLIWLNSVSTTTVGVSHMEGGRLGMNINEKWNLGSGLVNLGSFLGKFGKIICWCPLLEGWRPHLGESWIRHWLVPCPFSNFDLRLGYSCRHLALSVKQIPSLYVAKQLSFSLSFQLELEFRLYSADLLTGTGCARFAEFLTFVTWTYTNLEFRHHKKWSLNRQFHCQSKNNYRAQTPQNLALTKMLQKFQEN